VLTVILRAGWGLVEVPRLGPGVPWRSPGWGLLGLDLIPWFLAYRARRLQRLTHGSVFFQELLSGEGQELRAPIPGEGVQFAVLQARVVGKL